jgi:hypothetical protein
VLGLRDRALRARGSLERYGDGGKYKVVFWETAKRMDPIPFGDAPSGAMQGPRYTSFEKLKSAKIVADIFRPTRH